MSLFMNFIKYLISKFFFKQVIKSFAIVSFLLIVLFFYLKISTNHNNYINVLDLTGIEFDKAYTILNDNNLNYVDRELLFQVQQKENYLEQKIIKARSNTIMNKRPSIILQHEELDNWDEESSVV